MDLINYKPTASTLWCGRTGTYWHQMIKQIDLLDNDKLLEGDYALVGYACDEGVRRNHGRVGAKDAPDSIRRQLASIAWHHHSEVIDVGDAVCENENMEQCQTTLKGIVHHLLVCSITPIILGGGHDVAYGHFMGIESFLGKDKRIGIINFDAHFDLRPMTTTGNSGTPFYQILHRNNNAKYFPIGIQRQSNTSELFRIAKELQVEFVLRDDCKKNNSKNLLDLIQSFLGGIDHLIISIDLDAFSSSFAPGVSAPSPLGIEPWFVLEIMKALKASDKIISWEISECNPRFDIDGCTARLAARLIDAIIVTT